MSDSEERYRILLELESQLSVAREPIEAAWIIFGAADKIWTVDSGTLDVYLPDEDRVLSVLELDTIEGTRRQVTLVNPISKGSPRFNRIMMHGGELILRRPPITPESDSVLFGDVNRPSASIIAVPIRWQGRSVGVMSVQSYTPDAFTTEDLRTLQGLADHCGGALERIRMHGALRASEERFRALVEHNFDGINIVSGSGNLIYASPGNRALLGYSAEEVESRSAFATIHPEDQDEAQRAWRDMLAYPDQVFQPRLRFRHKDGSWRWMEVSARNLLHHPAVQGIVVNWHDVTERKLAERKLEQSQEQFQRLFQSSPMAAVLYAEADGRLRDINTRFLELFQFTREEVLGRTGAELGLWSDLTDRDRLVERLQREREVRGFETRMRSKSGRECDMLLSAQVIELADGPMVLMQANDITERRRFEEQFRQAQKMEAIGQLAGGVAHDFNNILGAILGNAQYALSDPGDVATVRECLEEIQKAGHRARSLVRQILTFSRQEPQERRVLALEPVVREAARFLQATIPASVEVSVSVDEEAPSVLADPTQLHQILVNLCTNAWHALEDRPGRIAIHVGGTTVDEETARTSPGLRSGRFACLSVRDTGHGIDDAHLKRIFDPFFTTKDPGKGTGLGLSVVHGIVQAHGGVITVVSQPGQGTAFQVYLPAAAADASAAAVPPPAGFAPKANAPIASSLPASPRADPIPARSLSMPLRGGECQHVLFLDDEEALVLVATRMLTRMGYRVSGFTCPAEALRAFREDSGRFALVITDHNMPGTTGLAVAAEILSIRPDFPVLLNSGRVTDELKQRALELGLRDVLYKPNTADDLADAIQRFARPVRSDVP